MKPLTLPVLAGAALCLAAQPVLADDAEMSLGVHDVTILSNTPSVQLAVRNMAASTDPAQRDLRVVSAPQSVAVSGQVWCRATQQTTGRALSVQGMFGQVSVVGAPNGTRLLTLGAWSSSAPIHFGGAQQGENYQLEVPLNVPENDDALVSLGLSPVGVVEDALESYLANQAGSAADFLRTDDVFEVTASLNVGAVCAFTQYLDNGEYAGVRRVDVPVRIFYQGDPDIQDVLTSMSGADTVAQPVPDRARRVAAPAASGSTPPARSAPPRRTTSPERVQDAPARRGD